VVFTGPAASAAYFSQIERFLVATLGAGVRHCYRVVIDDPAEVAREMDRGMNAVREYRRRASDAYNYNWLLSIPPTLQRPFEVSHESMRGLRLEPGLPAHELAAELRRAFSGIVTGNVKENGIRMIEEHGPFELRGAPGLLEPMDELLSSFVRERRMKLAGEYRPCYRFVS
jgi:hypothetical protein